MDTEETWAQRLSTPVIIAAIASVPAVFLTLMSDPYSSIGTVINWVSGSVFVAETVVLFFASSHKWGWVKRNWMMIGLTVLIVIAVAFAIGPMQLLRFVRSFGALRVLRAKRIFKAMRVLRNRGDTQSLWIRIGVTILGLLTATFVSLVLSDPTSTVHQFIGNWVGKTTSSVLAIIAGVIIAAATFIVVLSNRKDRDSHDQLNNDTSVND